MTLSEERDVNQSSVAGPQGVLPNSQIISDGRRLTLPLWCNFRLRVAPSSGWASVNIHPNLKDVFYYVVSDTYTVWNVTWLLFIRQGILNEPLVRPPAAWNQTLPMILKPTKTGFTRQGLMANSDLLPTSNFLTVCYATSSFQSDSYLISAFKPAYPWNIQHALTRLSCRLVNMEISLCRTTKVNNVLQWMRVASHRRPGAALVAWRLQLDNIDPCRREENQN